jgi:hypothetical protein
MTAFYILCGVAALVWLCGMAAGVLALGWGVAVRGRLRPALIMSIVAILIGWLGMLMIHVRYSKTVNGSGWAIDSKWFFLAPLLLGAVSLAFAFWKWMKSRHAD